MNDTLEQAIDRRAHGDWISWLVSRQTDDQIDLANQQMADVFTAHSDLGAFILVGGWAQFGPQAYAQVTDQVMDKLQSKDLVIVAGDTLPPQMQALKDGRSHAQIGQRPFEMGYRAPSVMIDLIEGKKTVGGSSVYRPRRMHDGQCGQLHRKVKDHPIFELGAPVGAPFRLSRAQPSCEGNHSGSCRVGRPSSARRNRRNARSPL